MNADDVLRAELAAPPRPPFDPDRFSSNVLFGEPGIYPQGSPMVPAPGDPPDESAAITALEAIGITDAAARLTDAELRRRAPEPGPRAGLVALAVTVGAPVLEAFLATSGTELARRQNSLAITLLNSRHPGSADVSVRAPDGPGTIPGGAPGMQTPDFWSIPFVGGAPVATDAPPLLGRVLTAVVGGETPSPLLALRYDDALGIWWSERGTRGALPLDAQWRASCALGLTRDDERDAEAGP